MIRATVVALTSSLFDVFLECFRPATAKHGTSLTLPFASATTTITITLHGTTKNYYVLPMLRIIIFF